MERPRIFVIFKEQDMPALNALLEGNKNNEFDFDYDKSLPRTPFHSPEAAPLKEELTERIKAATHLFCIIGKDTGNNEWINWEVQTASVKGKKVIGARLHIKNKSPAALLNFGSLTAKDCSFDALKEAVELSYTRSF